ncbi:MAG: AMP-binding protein, partial [Raoultibacter sp.]
MEFSSIIHDSAHRYPNKVAMRFAGKSYTYHEVADRVDRLASVLAREGVEKGSHVAVVAHNSHAIIEVVFACARLGAVCELVNTRLSPKTIALLLQHSEANIVFFSSCTYEPLRDFLTEIGRPLQAVMFDDTREYEDTLSYETLIDQAQPLAHSVEVNPSDPALLLYTSGTTGVPRGVLISHGALATRIEIDADAMRFAHDDITLCILPMYHVTSVSSLVTLYRGAELVIAQSRKAENIIEDIISFSVTRTSMVPFLLRELAQCAEKRGTRLTNLAYVVYGGGPVDPVLLTYCMDTLDCGLMQGYGMTETMAAVAMLLPEDHKDPNLLTTAGRAVPGMELKIIGDNGEERAPGISGEVLVKTPTVMLGYYHDEDRTAEVLRDGWYATGDIGFIDDKGVLTLIDRKNNLVITGGENVYPYEVSRCIQAMGDEIVDVVVTGVPDAYWGETLAAFVVRAEDSSITEADIAAYCACQLGGYKKPHTVVFVDDLPRNAAGKIPKDH